MGRAYVGFVDIAVPLVVCLVPRFTTYSLKTNPSRP